MTGSSVASVSTGELMDFRQFIVWSDGARRSMPAAELYCETRIARALAHLKPVIPEPAAPSGSHRCDLVQLWCKARGLAPSARTTLAAEGVRHSLQVIFAWLARSGATAALPNDVYPVYWQLAAQAQLPVAGFDLFPRFELSRILDAAAKAGARHVLLPLPLKLHGRTWTDYETAIAEHWLRADPQRRIVLDGVYGFSGLLDAVTRRLIATDQVLLLDSLSKGWLNERVFGVAVIPEQDVALYTPLFRNLAPSPSKLWAAHQLLLHFPDIPYQVVRELDTRRAQLLERVSRTPYRTLPAQRGYLVAIECAADVLLAEHSMLAIPASVFGSRLSNWSIASALPALEPSP
jgi:hypothetical protein